MSASYHTANPPTLPCASSYNETMLLEGIFPAITTPFYPDGRLYLRKLEHNVDRYSRTPVAGMVVLGSTGEAVMLGDEESREVLKIAIDSAAPEKVMLAGVARESVLETLRLADFAAAQRYDAVLVRTPNFYASSIGSREMLTYYRMVADRSALPVVLYNIPRFTRYELPLDVIVELASHPNILGLKDSTGNIQWLADIVAATQSAPRRSVTVTPIFSAVTARMLSQTGPAEPSTFVSAQQLGAQVGGGAALAVAPPKPAIKTRTKDVGFQVLCGAADKLADALDAGAGGGVLGLAACAPQVCQEIYTAWRDKDPALTALKQQRVVAASRLVTSQLGIPGIKYACDLNGYYGGRPRVPLLSVDAGQQAQIAAAMADLRN